MSWQTDYALANIQKEYGVDSAQVLPDGSIRITVAEKPPVVAVVLADHRVSDASAKQHHADFPQLDFLCGYRKECVWEGGAIGYLESNRIGWGSYGTLSSAIRQGDVKTSGHKEYFFSYRLIRQKRSITNLQRELDRVFSMTLPSGRVVRVGMVLEYEPTADSVRTFWDNFGPVDIVWSINPNGRPTRNAVEAAASLGCEVMKWNALKKLL